MNVFKGNDFLMLKNFQIFFPEQKLYRPNVPVCSHTSKQRTLNYETVENAITLIIVLAEI